MKSKLMAMLVFVLVLSAIGAPTSQASALPINLNLEEASAGPYSINSEIVINLVASVDNEDPGISAIEVYLTYSGGVKPPDGPGEAAAEVLPDFFGVSNFNINEKLTPAQCSTQSGVSTTLPCIHLILAGPAQKSQRGIAARFHFRATAAGSVNFALLRAVMVDADGRTKVPTIGILNPIIIQQTQVTGSAGRQGTANTPPISLACTEIKAINLNGWDYKVFTTPNGTYTFPNLPPGAYELYATYPGYLPSRLVDFVVPDNAVTLPVTPVTLRGGDVNGDKAINILDIGVIISKFGQTTTAIRSRSYNATNPGVSCQAGDEPADINDDGVINISDLAIAAGNWNQVSPTVWKP